MVQMHTKQHMVQMHTKECMERLSLRCSDTVFCVTIADADIESLGLFIHSLISVCTLYHKMLCEQKS